MDKEEWKVRINLFDLSWVNRLKRETRAKVMFNFSTFIVKGMNKNPFHNTWGNIKAWRYDICIEKCIFNEIAKSKSINFGCLLACSLPGFLFKLIVWTNH